MSLYSEFESRSPMEMIEALSIRMYQPPLSAARERLHEIAEVLQVPILVLEFDTEVSMNGILGFLENSTGLYLAETIAAFDLIGARETSAILRAIHRIMEDHGVSPAHLRADFSGIESYGITTFRELHGDLGSLPAEAEQEACRLYLYANSSDGEPWSQLAAFVETNRDRFLAEIARIEGESR